MTELIATRRDGNVFRSRLEPSRQTQCHQRRDDGCNLGGI